MIRLKITRAVNTVFESKTQGKRKVRRLRSRWLVDVENDLRETLVKRWRQGANIKEEYTSIINEAKVLKRA
jgi:hypothetical protein